MNAHDLTRRLIWHGILLFFLGLCVGMVVQSTRNPRMALSAHVGSVMSGMFLAILGAVWHHVRLENPAAIATFWLALYGMYVSSAGLVLAAIFGTGHRRTSLQRAYPSSLASAVSMTQTLGSSLSFASASLCPSAVMTLKSSPLKVISSTLRIVALSSTASRVLGTMRLLLEAVKNETSPEFLDDCAEFGSTLSSTLSRGGQSGGNG